MFSRKQVGVLFNMIVGIIISIALIYYGIYYNPFMFSNNMTLENVITNLLPWILLIIIPIIFTVGQVARKRFFSNYDIDASTSHASSIVLLELQATLQNTLEQSVIALLVYSAWIGICPTNYMSIIILSIIAFCIGRILFIFGYKKGAVARALGFCLTFYPQVLMTLIMIYIQVVKFLNA